MFADNSLTFNTSWTSSQTITSSVTSTSIVDITGAGSGNAPSMIGAGGLNTAMGVDIGQGDGMAIPYVYMDVVTAFVSAGGALMTVSLQAAPDNGSYSPGTYTTLYTSVAFTAANLSAAQNLIFQVPPRAIMGQPGEALPRFYRLSYTVTSSTFSAGAVNAGIMLNPPAGLTNTLYGSNITAL